MAGNIVLVVILAVVGLYLLLFHTAPFPLNHEEIGLGTNHMVHSIAGLVVLVIAGFIWMKKKKK